MKLSIIIPTLNEEKAIPETLRNVAESAPECEVIVVDGGSTDRTRERVGQSGARLVESTRGRGNQMNAGEAAAAGDTLLFLHADTHLPPDSADLVARALEDGRVIGGNFHVEFVPRSGVADFYSRCYNARSRLGIFYGDSAIFVRREVFERMGGYRKELLMEDIDLALRLRREGRLAVIKEAAVRSSTRRFPNAWVAIWMLGVWTFLHLLTLLGVKQEKLERLYPMVR